MSEDSDATFTPLPGDAEYVCPACGEEIVVPLDISAGQNQDYIEDCPVCCRPNHLLVIWRPDGSCHVRCEAE